MKKRIGKPLLANGSKAAHDLLPQLGPWLEIGPWSRGGPCVRWRHQRGHHVPRPRGGALVADAWLFVMARSSGGTSGVTRCTGWRGGGRGEALGRPGDGDSGGLTGSEAALAEEGGHGGRRWSRRSPWLRERARWSICGSNRMDGEPGQPKAELAKNGDGGDDLSRPCLLR
jgi:hypothetical protein